MRLILGHLWASWRTEIRYPSHLISRALDAVIRLVVALTVVAVVYTNTDSLNGWTGAAVAVLTGVYMATEGVVSLFVTPSLRRFVRDVYDGSFDITLLEPADAQVISLSREVDIWRMIDVFLGLGLAGFVAAREGWLTPVAALRFLPEFTLGCLILASLWSIVASSVFWLVRVDQLLGVLGSATQVAKWPVSVLPGGLRWMFTWIVPLGIAVSVPSGGLAQVSPKQTVPAWQFVVVSLAFAAVARLTWVLGLRRYSSTSS